MSATKQERDWISPKNGLPPMGEVVWAMDSTGHIQQLLFDRNLWWFPDRSMYVYYVPTFWKPVEVL